MNKMLQNLIDVGFTVTMLGVDARYIFLATRGDETYSGVGQDFDEAWKMLTECVKHLR